MNITFKTPDFRKAIVQLEKVEEKKLKEVQEAIEDSADFIILYAQQAAPNNEGILQGLISKKELIPYQYEIVAQTKYAAFMEFGTKTLVNIPPGAEEIANEARKIKGGTIEEMEKSIRRWVRLKGLAGTYSVKTRQRTGKKSQRAKEDNSLVFLIMRKILKVGVKPQPFFFPSIQKETPNLAKNLRKIIS